MLLSYELIRDSSVSVVTEVHAGLLKAADFSVPQSILTDSAASLSSAMVGSCGAIPPLPSIPP